MSTTTTIDPATGEQIETHTHHTDAEVTEVIEASQAAFQRWRLRPVDERAKLVGAVGQALRDAEDELAALMTREMGKPIASGGSEVALCAAICEWEAAHGPDALADEERELEGGRALVTYQPIGIVYGIQPWNFPIYQVIRYAIPNLVAGNTVLLKHASDVWGMAKRLEQLFRDAGLPDDVFRVLYIDHDQSDDVITHPLVRGVTLTGSDEAGRTIGSRAAGALKKTVLELGSNDAYVVLADADLDTAIDTCVRARIVNNGETCVAAKRFIVVDAIFDDFRDRYVEAIGAVRMRDPTDPETQLGPLVREDLRDELHEQVEQSVANGATVLVGGEVPDRPGAYYPATVLVDVEPGQPAYDDELFGPVASLIRAEDEQDAMRTANDSRYGLGGGIFSADEDRAVELARLHFDTGMVNVNGYHLAQPNLPFGGVKDSGYGREHGGFGIKEFVNAKTVFIV